eukprot:scaffold209791_cov42-Prasinocladus_malaysianus.AAC.3
MQVFCSKRKPNCSACPLQAVCEYAMAGGPRMEVVDVDTEEAAAAAGPNHRQHYDAVSTASVSIHSHDSSTKAIRTSSNQSTEASTSTAATPAVRQAKDGPQQHYERPRCHHCRPHDGELLVFEAMEDRAKEEVVASVLSASDLMYDDGAPWEARRAAALAVLGATTTTAITITANATKSGVLSLDIDENEVDITCKAAFHAVAAVADRVDNVINGGVEEHIGVERLSLAVVTTCSATTAQNDGEHANVYTGRPDGVLKSATTASLTVETTRPCVLSMADGDDEVDVDGEVAIICGGAVAVADNGMDSTEGPIGVENLLLAEPVTGAAPTQQVDGNVPTKLDKGIRLPRFDYRSPAAGDCSTGETIKTTKSDGNVLPTTAVMPANAAQRGPSHDSTTDMAAVKLGAGRTTPATTTEATNDHDSTAADLGGEQCFTEVCHFEVDRPAAATGPKALSSNCCLVGPSTTTAASAGLAKLKQPLAHDLTPARPLSYAILNRCGSSRTKTASATSSDASLLGPETPMRGASNLPLQSIDVCDQGNTILNFSAIDKTNQRCIDQPSPNANQAGPQQQLTPTTSSVTSPIDRQRCQNCSMASKAQQSSSNVSGDSHAVGCCCPPNRRNDLFLTGRWGNQPGAGSTETGAMGSIQVGANVGGGSAGASAGLCLLAPKTPVKSPPISSTSKTSPLAAVDDSGQKIACRPPTSALVDTYSSAPAGGIGLGPNQQRHLNGDIVARQTGQSSPAHCNESGTLHQVASAANNVRENRQPLQRSTSEPIDAIGPSTAKADGIKDFSNPKGIDANTDATAQTVVRNSASQRLLPRQY